MNFDRYRAAEEVNKLRPDAGSRAQIDGHPSRTKEPTQAILYGYHPSAQWAAVSFYEKVSEGIICEDYERDPPYERWKYQNHISAGSIVRPRALTQEESILARQYRGGNCWIKVTFDSVEAADRAFSNSPHLLQRHWVYAEPYYGTGPPIDEPIPMRAEDQDQGIIDPPKPSRPVVAQTLGPSFSRQNSISSRLPATLPRNFTNSNLPPHTPQAGAPDAASQASSTTISSATATAPSTTGPEQSALRNRLPPSFSSPSSPSASSSSPSSSIVNGRVRNSNFFTHFPDVPKTALRPAHEAFLPHPTWTESIINHLSAAGLLPSGMIGEGIPRLENGDFDWPKASMYWKVFYWIDSTFGSDFCGLRDE